MCFIILNFKYDRTQRSLSLRLYLICKYSGKLFECSKEKMITAIFSILPI